MRGERHQGVNAPAAARVRVRDAEDIRSRVAGEGVAEEDRPA